MTFYVDDLRQTVAELVRDGFRLEGTDLSPVAWRQAFLGPCSAFGTLLQLVEVTDPSAGLQHGISLDDVLAGRVVLKDHVPCLSSPQTITAAGREPARAIHPVENVGSGESPVGLLRSKRQSQILAVVLQDPDTEFSLSALSAQLNIPYASVHREVKRAVATGIVVSRRDGGARLVRANSTSRFYTSLLALLGDNT